MNVKIPLVNSQNYPKKFKMDSTAKKTVDSQSIYQKGNESAISEEPFGLAYDIDSLPKISMVHTLDRVPEMLEKRSTFIDIYSGGALDPNRPESPESPNHAPNGHYIDQKGDTPTLNPIGSLKRGILYEAACNAKRFARGVQEMRRGERVGRNCDAQSCIRNLRGAVKREQNQRQICMADIKFCKQERPGFKKTRPPSGGNHCTCHWNIHNRRHCNRDGGSLIEANEDESIKCHNSSDSKFYYLDEQTDDYQRKRNFPTDLIGQSVTSTNLSKRDRAHFEVTVEIEHNSALPGDLELCDEYHCHCFTAEDCQPSHQGKSARVKFKRKAGLFINHSRKK